MKTACVFAHYDRHNKVDDYVLYYLRELKKVAGLVEFVTTSELNHAERRKVEALEVNVIQRENEGYDFRSYQSGIDAIDLSQFDELILCNDSMYGPFSELRSVFDEMRGRGAHFWGLTDSYDYQHHLQSYFLVFTREALQSPAFREFWQSVQVLDDKLEIIRRYEVGLSRSLESAGFRLEALAASPKVGNLQHIGAYWRYYFTLIRRRWKERKFWIDSLRVMFGDLRVGKNATHLDWKFLIEESDVPFIKVGLLRDNPKGMTNLDELYDVIRRISDYPVQCIEDHLARTRDA